MAGGQADGSPSVGPELAEGAPEEPAEGVVVELASRPTGAVVFAGWERLGVTPLRLTRPHGTRLRVTLRRSGYRSEAVSLDFEADGRRSVELRRRAGAGDDTPARRAPRIRMF